LISISLCLLASRFLVQECFQTTSSEEFAALARKHQGAEKKPSKRKLEQIINYFKLFSFRKSLK